MPISTIFDIAGSAMNAQTIRLNTIASNMANADTVSGSAEEAYRARHPLFATLLQEAAGGQQRVAGVEVKAVVESTMPPIVRYAPNHPLADAKGNIYSPNVNLVEEMANMISASRSYQSNVEVFNTSKQLLLQTLNIGR